MDPRTLTDRPTQRRRKAVNGNRHAVRKTVFLDPRDDAEGDALDLVEAAATVGRMQPFIRSMILAGVREALRDGTVPPSILAEANRVRKAKGVGPLRATGPAPTPQPPAVDLAALLGALTAEGTSVATPAVPTLIAPVEGAAALPTVREGPPPASDDGASPSEGGEGATVAKELPRPDRDTTDGPDATDDILGLMGFDDDADPF